MKTKTIFGLMTLCFSIVTLSNSIAQKTSYTYYPKLYDSITEIVSPYTHNDSIETILVVTKNKQYGIVPVTMENGKPLLYSYRVGTFMGKDQQMQIDAGDFPSLAKTGLHNEAELVAKRMITGIPIDVINCTAKPNGYSISGFMAEDEDIISILKNDNRTVQKLGLTHSWLARPLFHIWNLILKEYELGNWGRFYDNIKFIHYNGNILNFKAIGTKGWQISIFLDEIQGRHDIHIDRNLTNEEEEYLNKRYSSLGPEKLKDLKYRLSHLDFSEMNPYYIMRYGFYEGHTSYRADPIAIAVVFGLKSIKDIDVSFNNDLYNILNQHFTINDRPGNQIQYP